MRHITQFCAINLESTILNFKSTQKNPRKSLKLQGENDVRNLGLQRFWKKLDKVS